MSIALRIVIVFIALGCGSANADKDVSSANYILDACKEKPSESLSLQGVCIGETGALLALVGSDLIRDANSNTCIPGDVTVRQAKAVIIKFIDERPEKMHESFLALALAAFKAAWPCKP